MAVHEVKAVDSGSDAAGVGEVPVVGVALGAVRLGLGAGDAVGATDGAQEAHAPTRTAEVRASARCVLIPLGRLAPADGVILEAMSRK